MSVIDPFSSDAFELTSLTASINALPYTPHHIADLGIYDEAGITTLSAMVEVRDGTLSIVDVEPRGSQGKPVTEDKPEVFDFRVPHLPEVATIMADEVQGKRAFGTENQTETVKAVVNDRLLKMRRRIDYTIELHRLENMRGNYIDHNGNVKSLAAQFGITPPPVVQMDLSATAPKLRQKVLDAQEQSEEGLADMPATGFIALCGKQFWRDWIEAKDVKDSYANAQTNAALRSDPRQEFEWGGVMWMRYRGTTAVKVADDEAYLVPAGAPGLFITRFAPADYTETVNTTGLPYYASTERMKHGKGVEIEAQSNPINLCTRPGALVRLSRLP